MGDFIRGMLGAPSNREGGREPAERSLVAACVVLLETAHADGEFHGMEALLLQDLLSRKFDLPPDAVEELLRIAGERREASLDLYRFTSLINESFDREEKIELIGNAWRIIYADGVLDKYEEFLVRRLTALLRLSHRDMIDAKVKVLDEVGRGNVRPPPPGRE